MTNDVVYFNGPVQNGDFTLAERPGKAAGIRLAEALNALLGLAPVPHLWNTVTLAGDVRHPEQQTGTRSTGGSARNRPLRQSTHPARPRRAAYSPTPTTTWHPWPWT